MHDSLLNSGKMPRGGCQKIRREHMIKVEEYRGHIRNWEELCERLEISLTLSREEREEQILIRAYETWGYEMADHMHGMYAFALWDEDEKRLFCLRDPFGTKPTDITTGPFSSM